MEQPVFFKIPKGSTLDEMALFFEMDKNYLKRYHNIYCELADLIEAEIPRHLEKLFVPQKDKKYEKDLMPGGSITAFSPSDVLLKNKLFYKEYGVIQTTYDSGKQINRITFLTEIKKNDASRFSIARKSIYINNKAPDLTMEQIAEKAGSIFFPFEVEVLENGNLKQILNIDQIRKRWKEQRAELLKYYKGKTAETKIERIDNELADKNLIQNRLLGSLFYRLYFLPFRDYVKEIGKEFDLYLPLFPFKNKVRYHVNITKQPELSETGKMLLQIKGKLTDTRTFSEIMNGKMQTEIPEKTEKCKGSIDALYKFNREEGSIYSVEAEIILESEDGKNQKKIIFELYQQ